MIAIEPHVLATAPCTHNYTWDHHPRICAQLITVSAGRTRPQPAEAVAADDFGEVLERPAGAAASISPADVAVAGRMRAVFAAYVRQQTPVVRRLLGLDRPGLSRL